MSKSYLAAVLVLALGMSSLALASGDEAAGFDGNGNKTVAVGKGTGRDTRPISWDELKERCLNPDSFPYDVQRQPQNIKIQCTDVRHEWVPVAPGSVDFASWRKVKTAVFSDKFHVVEDTRDVPFAQKGGSCLRFKEVERVFTIERPLSCAEVVGMKMAFNDYCISSTEMAKGSNPKLASERETGEIIDTCGDRASKAERGNRK